MIVALTNNLRIVDETDQNVHILALDVTALARAANEEIEGHAIGLPLKDAGADREASQLVVSITRPGESARRKCLGPFTSSHHASF